MAGRRRRTAVPSACGDCLQRSRFIWIPSLLTLILGILVIIFEQLPHAKQGEVQGIKQITNDISLMVRPKLSQWIRSGQASALLLNRQLPSWIPLWSINKPVGVIDRRLPPINELDQDAHRILPLLDRLKEHKFFRIFKTDLSKECPFWARREMCTSPGSCQICECDEDQIPKVWRMKPIKNFVDRYHYKSNGEIKPWGATPSTASSSSTTSTSTDDDDDDDYGMNTIDNEITELRTHQNGFGMFGNPLTVSDEESSTASYVDLTLNRPGYTAYRGRNIWGLIYKENCLPSNPLQEPNLTVNNNNECTEEEAFYKIISGMQTVIMVLSAEYHDSRKTPEAHLLEIEELKREGKIVHASTFRSQYSPDLTLFKERVAIGREWIENLYFTFGVLLKTFCHVGPILEACDCDTGTPDDDALARRQLHNLLNESFNVCQLKYKDEPLFTRKQHVALRQFQNISRIMDCLECEKCRLHGKVKILALQLALKASGSDAKIRKLERNEIIALVNALEYFADGIVALHRFEMRLSKMRMVWVSSIAIGAIGIGLCIRQFQLNKKKRRKQLEEEEERREEEDEVEYYGRGEHHRGSGRTAMDSRTTTSTLDDDDEFESKGSPTKSSKSKLIKRSK